MTGRRLVLGLVALSAASGCDEAVVDPFLRDAPPYSMYGLVVADVTARVQKVRVQRVRATVDPPTDPSDPAADVRGTFTSAGASGGSVPWSPRTIVYTDGSVGTVFERSFQPDPSSQISVRFEDPEGQRIDAEVVLPPTPTATVQDPVETGADDTRDVRQRIVWDAVRLTPPFVVDYEGLDRERRIQAVRVEYGRESIVDGTTVEIDLLRDLLLLVQEGVSISEAGTIDGLRIRMQATALTDVFPPVDVIPNENLGRVFVQGAAVGRVFWSPDVALQ